MLRANTRWHGALQRLRSNLWILWGPKNWRNTEAYPWKCMTTSAGTPQHILAQRLPDALRLWFWPLESTDGFGRPTSFQALLIHLKQQGATSGRKAGVLSRCSWALLSRRSTHLFLLPLKNSNRSSVCCFKVLTTSTDRAFKGGSHPFRNNSKLFPMGFAAVKQIFPRSPAPGTNYCTPRHKVTESPELFSNPLAPFIRKGRRKPGGWVCLVAAFFALHD